MSCNCHTRAGGPLPHSGKVNSHAAPVRSRRRDPLHFHFDATEFANAAYHTACVTGRLISSQAVYTRFWSEKLKSTPEDAVHFASSPVSSTNSKRARSRDPPRTFCPMISPTFRRSKYVNESWPRPLRRSLPRTSGTARRPSHHPLNSKSWPRTSTTSSAACNPGGSRPDSRL